MSSSEQGEQFGNKLEPSNVEEVCQARLTGSPARVHGHCFGFEGERATWQAPRMAVHSAAEARPGYNTMNASEYLDDPATLRAKVKCLARLVSTARTPVFYCGAGLSTAAGIGDYASQACREIGPVGVL